MPTTTSSPPGTSGPRGFTLLELLVVISILGVLLGLGIGVYGSLVTPDTLATGRITDAVRSARLLAQREGLPASVMVDPVAGDVYALGLRAAGNWHFEDEAGTGWPVNARGSGGVLVPDGVIGSALHLGQGADLLITGLSAAADSPQGFGVELWLRPDGEPRPMTLLERPGRWTLRFDEDDVLQISLWLDARPAAEELRRDVPEARLPPDRFTRLAVTFDGRTLHVEVDGQRCGEDTVLPATRLLSGSTGAALRTGEGLSAFRGALDELRLLSVASNVHEPLPTDVKLLGAARMLRLDAFGRLDPSFHSGAEVVAFEWGDPRRRTSVELGAMGAVRTWTDKP